MSEILEIIKWVIGISIGAAIGSVIGTLIIWHLFTRKSQKLVDSIIDAVKNNSEIALYAQKIKRILDKVVK